MSKFYFIIRGEELKFLKVTYKSPSRKTYEDRSLDVAKVQAEADCREKGYNAFIDYTAVTDSNGVVKLIGTPANISADPTLNTRKSIAKIGSATFSFLKRHW